jgi:hypothetical protein
MNAPSVGSMMPADVVRAAEHGVIVTLLGTAGFLLAMAVVVPLLAYGLSALLDRSFRRGGDGNDGQGGVLAPRPPSPSGPAPPMTRSTEPGKEEDGTVS